jgi:SAM-dependent methyltransferase
MIHEERRRAESFGTDAGQYDRARPGYPAALIDDLVDFGTDRVLDVGCGTGIAARLFAERGCRVHGVESDERMAAVARAHGLTVDISQFERWEWEGEPFDLVISAQAWHWVDPEIGPAKVAAVLRPGGRFAAFWNQYSHEPRVQEALGAVYKRVAPGLWRGSVALGTISEDELARGQAADCAALTARGFFDPPERRSYSWTRTYDRKQWLDELPTHSGHRTLDPQELNAVLDGVGEAIDRLGGQIVVRLCASMITAVRRSEANGRDTRV